ncbi:MAG TPA: ComEC/Rec2 family competence protein [Clostridia bacterium]|nr:ComEC/Rec2 family competence protein [Clostridia bacterium]
MKITNYRPLTFITISLLLGVTVGGLVYNNNLFLIVVPIALVAMGIFMSIIFKRKIICFLILFFVIGIVSFKIDNLINFSHFVDTQVSVEGKIYEKKGDYVILDSLSFDDESYKGRLIAPIYGLKNAKVGDNVKFYGKVATNEVDIFDTYAMSRYNDKIFYEITNPKNIEISDGEQTTIQKIRGRLTQSILQNMPREEGGIAISLVFGDMNYITEYDNDVMRATGLSHIFSVSGLHVGFLVALLIFLGKKLKIKAVIRLVVIAVLLSCYGLLTGFPSGVKRAAIMSLIYLLSVVLYRKNDPLNTLSLSVLVIVILNPKELFDISFIMSVAAILGMVCFYRPIKRFLQGKSYNKARIYLASSVAATISANVFLLPVACNIFNSFAIYQLVSNLLMLPLVTFIYTALMPILILSFIYPKIGVLNKVISYPITLLRVVTEAISRLPSATLNMNAMGVLTALYIIIAIALSPFIKFNYKKV